MCGERWPHETDEEREACDARMKAWIKRVIDGASICAEAELRSKMTDDEFWSHVFMRDVLPEFDPPEVSGDEPIEPDDECSECGAAGACAYDAEGRPMIHATGYRDE